MSTELLAIAATIKAAEILADSTKSAAIISGVIGGVGIGVGLFISWMTALHLQRVSRLVDTRKVVYLELVEEYSNMLIGFYGLGYNIRETWEAQRGLIYSFSRALDKAGFVCETATKAEIFKFAKVFKEKYLFIDSEISPIFDILDELNDLDSKHSKIMQRFNDAATSFEIIKRESPNSEKLDNILKYFDEKLEESKQCLPLITAKEAEFKAKKALIHDLILEFTEALNDMVFPITHLLRKELGAKTDIILDKKLHLDYKNM